MKKNIMMVGVGPHAKRIYFNYFKNHNICPKIIVDLESNEVEIKNYLKINGYVNTVLWLLPDKYKDYERMPSKQYNELLNLCRKHKINYIISSTEPKAHNMYLLFALENNINILSDKPITVVKGMNCKKNIAKVKKQYYDLLSIYNSDKCKCNIMCQRQYHKGYIYIKQLLKEIVSKYGIPITYIDIYHCDGNWEMLHDLEKENHPYKYGYGKLYHSGYHFIDLLAELIKLNDTIDESKKITKCKIYGDTFTPNDEKMVFSKADYINIFGLDASKEVLEVEDKNYNEYGEKNFYGNLNFYNKTGEMITKANINLLHYGFSRRGWVKSKDYYKNNGRIRHERINIHVGPLMNIQIHSYQSKEIKDRTNSINEIMTGGLEHFDIDIYRNVDLIGGVPFQRIKLMDLYNDDVLKNKFIGYNEYSREEFISSFLNDKKTKSDLKSHKLVMDILINASLVSIKKAKVIKFDVVNYMGE